MSGWRRSFFLIAAFALRTFQLSVEQGGCNHTDVIKKKECESHVIRAYHVWTEIQCLDVCLRLNFCDYYIFNGREEEHNCLLLKSDVTHVAGSDQLEKKTGQCRVVRSHDEKTPRDFLLGTSRCPELENGNDDSEIPNEPMNGQ